jgi:hypothetical protein
MHRRIIAPAAAALAVLGVTAWMAGGADAATPACTAVPGNACGSWNAEVPGLPDLDVLGGAAVSGNSIIVFTRTNHDRAEDFMVQPADTTGHSKYEVAGTFGTWSTTLPNPAVPGAARIQYAPSGVPSGFCVSSVNPDGFAAAQLRPCDSTPGEWNPYQTFQLKDTGNPGDGQFVTFREVINGHLLTDPDHTGGIGVIGSRIHVTFAGGTGTIRTGQLWGQNGA